jgi:hypothetical protein
MNYELDEDLLDKNSTLIRAKWTMDGAKTLHEAAKNLRQAADNLEKLKKEGWELISPVEDDYGHIRRDPKP